MRLTERDRRLLAKLAAARWLTTRQVAALCFPAGTLEPARRRLRMLGEKRYVFSSQTNHMAAALHSLGPKGRELLVERGWTRPISLERVPPKNLEHFLGVNDIRVAVERSAMRDGMELGFFYASWELQQHGWTHAVIPDAACHLARNGRSATILFEYDRGTETPRYVVQAKLRPYAHGLDGFPFCQVLVVVETDERLEQLREYAASHMEPEKLFFVTLETLTGSWSPSDLLG